MSIDASRTKSFWDAFSDLSPALTASCEESRDIACLELTEALEKIDPDLVLQVAEIETGHSLVISANGVRDLVDTAVEIVATCERSQHPGWQIRALRTADPQALSRLESASFPKGIGGLRCQLSQELRRIDITVLIEGFDNSHYYSYLEDVFTFLDLALGEEMVAKEVGEICLRCSREASSSDSFSFSELPERFQAFRKEVQGELELLKRVSPAERGSRLFNKSLGKAIRCAQGYTERGCLSLCFEVYFHCEDTAQGELLVDSLASRPGYVADLLTLGGVGGPFAWVHCWFDLSELDSETFLIASRSTLGDLRLLAGTFGCELEGAFISPTTEALPFDDMLISLGEEQEPAISADLARTYDLNDDELIGYLSYALEEDPYNIELRGQMAHALARKRQDSEAAEILEELKDELELGAESPETYWNIARTYALLQEATLACKYLRSAFQLSPRLREQALEEPDLFHLKGESAFDELLFNA